MVIIIVYIHTYSTHSAYVFLYTHISLFTQREVMNTHTHTFTYILYYYDVMCAYIQTINTLKHKTEGAQRIAFLYKEEKKNNRRKKYILRTYRRIISITVNRIIKFKFISFNNMLIECAEHARKRMNLG